MAVLARHTEAFDAGRSRRAVHVLGALGANTPDRVAQRQMIGASVVVRALRQALVGQRIAGGAFATLVLAGAIEAPALERHATDVDGLATPLLGTVWSRAMLATAFAAERSPTGEESSDRGKILHTARRRGRPAPGAHRRRRSACTTRLHVRLIGDEIERGVPAPPRSCQKQEGNRHK